MHFSTIFTTAAAILLTSPSLPLTTASPVGDAKLKPRQGTIGCTYTSPGGVYYAYTITVPNDKIIDATCGGGFLDNLHGRGCSITAWGCDYVNGSGARITFNADPFCGPDDVSAASNAAAQGKYPGVVCNGA
ncbi:hypothetical protein TWF694_001859 [Orbilia ellipsospora]|uniref:Uncharacterized protein n=1 Tax=Orbilia ellipsospora TaxID=2528407 RepID=A0AAV9X515_9PEZI